MPRPKPKEVWNPGHYSMRLTTPQRVALAQLGGAKWVRAQIDKAIKEKLDEKCN